MPSGPFKFHVVVCVWRKLQWRRLTVSFTDGGEFSLYFPDVKCHRECVKIIETKVWLSFAVFAASFVHSANLNSHFCGANLFVSHSRGSLMSEKNN